MKRNNKKLRCISFLLIVIMLFGNFCIFSFAENRAAEPLYENTTLTNVSLKISGVNSTSYAKVSTNTIQQITITMELQKLKNGAYTTVKTWTAMTTNVSLQIQENRLINALSSYRLKVTFDVDSDHIVKYAYPT